MLDPLYPATNPTWGRSPAPGTRLTIAELGRDFVERRIGSGTANGRNRSLGGRFVLVIPMERTPSLSPAGMLIPG